jgi:hypothetical protein
VLLDENGQLIQDICMVKFTTELLLVATKHSHEKSYNKYKYIIESSLLKPHRTEHARNNSKMQNEETNNNNNNNHEHPIAENGNIDKLIKKRAIMSSRKMLRTTDKLFPQCKMSKSLTRFSSFRDRRAKSNLDTLFDLPPTPSLKRLLSTNTQSSATKKRHEGYEEAFKKLRSLNRSSFNVLNLNELLMSVFKAEFELLKTKTPAQVDCILSAFDINPADEYISLEDFIRINEVVQCKGRHEDIVAFVGRYLPFNECGELEKQGLLNTLKFVLSNDVRSHEVVLNTIWSWFEKNNLTKNGVIVKSTL